MYDTGSEAALQEISRHKPVLKNRVEPSIEAAVVKMAFEYPPMASPGPAISHVSKASSFRQGASAVYGNAMDLEVFDKRLKSLEAHMAKNGSILTEAQMITLERKKEKKEAHGEIETEHLRSLGSKDTYYVGTIKGLGPNLPANFY